MLYVVRHGESTVNIERKLTCRLYEGDLTDLGRDQATRAGQWLAKKRISKIRTSPFHRAIQTAEIIQKYTAATLSIDDGLREVDCGELEGHRDQFAWNTWQEVFTRWRAADWNASFPGGESFRTAHERLSRTLLESSNEHNTVLVTHGAVTLSVIPYLCVNAAALQRVDGLSNTGMILLEPYDIGRYVCEAWNLVAHLAP